MSRARNFADAYGLRVPILLAPMAGACPASLWIAVAGGGGLGACDVLMMSSEELMAHELGRETIDTVASWGAM